MIRRLALFLILLICTACDQIPMALPFGGETPSPAPTATFGVTPVSTATLALPVKTEAVQGGVLRLWLPPQFSPTAGDRAAAIFQDRLDQFASQNPGWQVEVRIKAVEGPGGLVESLAAANTAASAALPDLIALPRPLLEIAATKGLLRPFDALTTVMTAGDWYEYSRDLARIQNNIFGLPFAGDALVLIYRSGAISTPPASWQQLTAIGLPLAFPVADSKGLFPLHLYQGAGGPVVDGQGHPTIDTSALTQVLTFTLAAERAGVMPNWLGLYENYDQTWQVYVERRASLTVNWASRYLNERQDGDAAALLPTLDGSPFAQASGWSWALVTTDPERQKVATALAEFLVDGDFLSEWSAAAGQLPTRSTATVAQDDDVRAFVRQVVSAAQVYPSADVAQAITPLLEQAFLQVFKLQVDPEVAARQAVEALTPPK
jgi:ABC-type glycerol-3-phosphate transport system substrate-binding protein